MLDSFFEADDAVQETMLRAWRGVDGFEGRSARQCAVRILREVLRWRATEVAELRKTSMASVNSALCRCRPAASGCVGRSR